jgi:cytochrome c551/c552
MKNRSNIITLLFGVIPMMVAFSAVAAEPAAATAEPAAVAAKPEAVDADAAIKLARSAHCLRCHGVTKKKEGPPYNVIAAFYKSNKDAEEVLIEHVTMGAKVKLSDGHKENHKSLADKTPEQIKNLVRWILAQ